MESNARAGDHSLVLVLSRVAWVCIGFAYGCIVVVLASCFVVIILHWLTLVWHWLALVCIGKEFLRVSHPTFLPVIWRFLVCICKGTLALQYNMERFMYSRVDIYM